MPVEDHPMYQKWSDALEYLKEANDRFRDAIARKDKAIETYRLDLVEAKKRYDEVADKIEPLDP